MLLARSDSQGEVVEAHRPQREGPGQEAHVGEEHADGLLEGGELLQDRRGLDQLPVRLGLLDLQPHAGTHTHTQHNRTQQRFSHQQGNAEGL